jgi:hypothetical protein
MISAKPINSKAARELDEAKLIARQLGIPGEQEQHQNYLKIFGKQVGQQLRYIKAGQYDKGPGSIVLSHDYDLSQGHEPEIAARLKLLSAKLGKPVYIISGYRTPQHSVEVGGFADDPHTKGEAADIGVGSPTLASAAAISEADYESVGLYRPFGTARGGSSAEDNHVQLLNGGTPVTAGSGGGSVSGGVSGGGYSVGGAVSTSGSGVASSGGSGGRSAPRPFVASSGSANSPLLAIQSLLPSALSPGEPEEGGVIDAILKRHGL